MNAHTGLLSLRVTNMVMTGRLPEDVKVDFTALCHKGWRIINEEICPIVQKRFERPEKTLSVHFKKHSITVSIWSSGAVNIVGLRAEQEGRETFEKVIQEVMDA